MNHVKLEVSLDPSNSEHREALNFFLSVIGNKGTREVSVTNMKVVDAETVSTKKVEKVEAKKIAEENTTKAVEEATKEEEKLASKSSVKIEDIRKVMSEKIEDNRDAIKAKLVEFKANNVSSLKEDQYSDFLEFLNSL